MGASNQNRIKYISEQFLDITKIVCCGIVIKNNNQLLLIRRAKLGNEDNPNSNSGAWEFPGGGYEKDKDIDYKSCVIREVKEETDLDVHIIKFIKEEITKNNVLVKYYHCAPIDYDQPVNLQKDPVEHDMFGWFDDLEEIHDKMFYKDNYIMVENIFYNYEE